MSDLSSMTVPLRYPARVAGWILLLAGMLGGCDLLADDSNRSIGLALEAAFVEDRVEVQIDGETVFLDTVTTEPSLGLAASAEISIDAGRHHLRVRVDDVHEAAWTFSTRDLKGIAIFFVPTSGEIGIELRDHVVRYD